MHHTSQSQDGSLGCAPWLVTARHRRSRRWQPCETERLDGGKRSLTCLYYRVDNIVSSFVSISTASHVGKRPPHSTPRHTGRSPSPGLLGGASVCWRSRRALHARQPLAASVPRRGRRSESWWRLWRLHHLLWLAMAAGAADIEPDGRRRPAVGALRAGPWPQGVRTGPNGRADTATILLSGGDRTRNHFAKPGSRWNIAPEHRKVLNELKLCCCRLRRAPRRQWRPRRGRSLISCVSPASGLAAWSAGRTRPPPPGVAVGASGGRGPRPRRGLASTVGGQTAAVS